MPVKKVTSNSLTWYYITGFLNEESEFIKKNFKFHPLDLKDCAGEAQRSKIDVYKNYLFIVLQIPQLDQQKVHTQQLYFFVGSDYVISICHERIKPLNNFFYKIINHKRFREEIFAQNSGYILYRALEHLLRESWAVHGQLDEKIRHAEVNIDEGRGKQLVFDIALIRRMILQLKSIIDPERIVTHTLSRLNTAFLGKEMAVYFDDLDDFTEKQWLSLESHKDRVLSLQEINESLISYRTNQIMKVLTSFSVALLPLTLLSGIYGMNVPLPFSDHPGFIWLVFGSLIIAISGIFVYLKKKDWI